MNNLDPGMSHSSPLNSKLLSKVSKTSKKIIANRKMNLKTPLYDSDQSDNSQEDFTYPKRTRRNSADSCHQMVLDPLLAETSTASRYKINPTAVHNKYSLLADPNLPLDDAVTQTSTNNNNKTIWIPPIFLFDVNNIQEMTKDFKKLSTEDFELKFINNNKIKLSLKSTEDFRTITRFLDENKINFYSFTHPEDKKLSVVLRPVAYSFTDEEISQELSQSFPVVKVVRLYNKEKMPTPLVSVLLEKNEKGKEIFKLDRLLQTVISVEPRHKSQHVRCTNCQIWGHTRGGCHLPPTCARCAAKHPTSQCNLTADQKPTCVHCGGEHPAYSRQCQAYLRYLEGKERRQLQTKTQAPRSRRPTPPDLDFLRPSPELQDAPPPQWIRAKPPKPPNESRPTSEPTIEQDSFLDSIFNFIKKLIKPILPKLKSFFTSLITSFLTSNND